jgi:trk system potassium uptake protein
MSRAPRDRYPRTVRRTAAPREVEVEPERRRRLVLRAESAPLLLIGGFLGAILIGTVLLILPISAADGSWTSPVIALFVATSAVCVTGLTPVDTGTYWSGFGQGVILVLFQFGGFGFMTSATLLFLLFGWRVGMRERRFLSQTLDIGRLGGIVGLVRRAIIFTIAAETVGFIVLTARFAFDEPFRTAIWYGLFHSVSAFNNAGFDVFGDFRSLTAYDDLITLTTVAILVVLGGIGYLVVENVLAWRRAKLSVDSKIILWTTGGLVLVGFVFILTMEWDATLAGLSVPDKTSHALFASVAPRTAGFTALPVDQMTEETLFFTMALMFIGGASGSTAGGIKVGTFGILVIGALSAIAGRQHVEAGGREIRRSDMDRALAVTFLAVVLVFVISLALVRIEEADFLSVLFEATSAFGTVGLSTGITPDLRDASLLITTVAMFIGRLGPLTLVLALVQRTRPERRRLAEDHVRIG